MTTIEDIYFPDAEFTLKEVQGILKQKEADKNRKKQQQ